MSILRIVYRHNNDDKQILRVKEAALIGGNFSLVLFLGLGWFGLVKWVWTSIYFYTTRLCMMTGGKRKRHFLRMP
jgi:hypothetical protein